MNKNMDALRGYQVRTVHKPAARGATDKRMAKRGKWNLDLLASSFELVYNDHGGYSHSSRPHRVCS